MDLVKRAEDLLLKPRETWSQIDAEPASIRHICCRYLIWLFAIPVICNFIGSSLIGTNVLGFHYRVPMVRGIVWMVVSYAMTFAATYVLALIIDAWAPVFGGTRDLARTFALLAYAGTANCVSGLFSVVPTYSALGLIGSLYSIVLFYFGLPVMTRTPRDKVIPFTLVALLCGIVLIGAIGFAAGEIGYHPGAQAMRVEAASELTHIDALQRALRGSSTAHGEDHAKPFAADALKSLLPMRFLDLPRTSIDAAVVGGGGMATVHAHYERTGRHIDLTIRDVADDPANALFGTVSVDNETEHSVERIYHRANRSFDERYQKDGSECRYVVFLSNGISVEADARGFDIALVKAAVEALGLARIEAMQRPPA